jgi:hypothetical protein
MLLAPLVMASIFVPLSAGVGFLVGQPGPFLTLSLLGALVILLLGYAYVGLVLLLRRALSSQLQEGIAAR